MKNHQDTKAFRCSLCLGVLVVIYPWRLPASSPALEQLTLSSPALRTLVSVARGAPPEFAADVLLTIVESGVALDPRTRRELLEEALALAPYAQEKVKLQRVEPGGEYMAAVTLQKGLDQVSLRARTVRELLKTEPQRARDLFSQIDLPLANPFKCEDQFSYHLSTYYSVMTEIMTSLAEPERAQFFQDHMPRFRSTSQIVPIIQVLLAWKGSPEALAAAASLFAGRLPKLDADRRVFTFAYAGAIRTLARFAGSLPAAQREDLIERSRAWVLNGVQHGLCAERPQFDLNRDGTRTPVVVVSPVDLFHRALSVLSERKPGPTIRPEEIKYVPTGAVSAADRSSNEWKQFARLQALLERDDAETKESPRWQIEMQRYITALHQWKEDEGALDRHYLEKAERLHAVLSMRRDNFRRPGMTQGEWSKARKETPLAKVPGRDQVVQSLVEWFDSGVARTVYNRRRIIWFSPVWSLLISTEHTTEVDDLMLASKHPVLHLYGALSKFMAEQGRPYY